MLPITTQLRNSIINQLKRCSKLLANVMAEQFFPVTLEELPAIRVSLDKASVISDWLAINANGQMLEMVECPIVIKITATASARLEEGLEELAAQVSQSLAQDETLGGLVKSLRLDEDAEFSISHEGEQPIGVLTMRFIALYRRPALNLSITCN